MNDALRVRNATIADLPFLVESNAAMALETEKKVLDRTVLERGVAAVFEQPARGFYLVAEYAGHSAGCLLITYEWSDWRDGEWWWLQSVYVVPAARRSGVFRALHGCIERRAAARSDVIGLRLYVETENHRAQSTYTELRMQRAPYVMLEAPLTPALRGSKPPLSREDDA
ncbi:MAG TPA: GNAT family N-acetyltransferase [Dokdonella sp.]